MTVVAYKYLKVYEGRMTGSSVQLEITPNNLGIHRITIDSENIPFRSQGLKEGGYENWNKSAQQALQISLERLNHSPKLDILVKKLEGRILLDTNNAAVGVAFILALWKYLEIQPGNEMMDKIHLFVKEDWRNKVEVIPDFQTIFAS